MAKGDGIFFSIDLDKVDQDVTNIEESTSEGVSVGGSDREVTADPSSDKRNAVYEGWGYVPDMGTSGGQPGDIPITPAYVPEDPIQETEYETIVITTSEIVHDYSQEALNAYRESGAYAVRVYTDGSEEIVDWSEVVDPHRMDSLSIEIQDLAARSSIADIQSAVSNANERLDSQANDLGAIRTRANDAYQAASDLQTDINTFKTTAAATYSTKTETDEKTGAITRTMAANYATKAENAASTNPNLLPFYAQDFADIRDLTSNPGGYWVSSPTRATKLTDGWAHVVMNNSAGSGTMYAYVRPAAQPALSEEDAEYTLLIEIRNMDSDVTLASNHRLWFNGNSDTATKQVVVDLTRAQALNNTGTSTTVWWDSDGVYHLPMRTSTLADSPSYAIDGWFAVNKGHRAEFDARLSLYRGDYYSGGYKPYVAPVETLATKHEVEETVDSYRRTIEQTYASKDELTGATENLATKTEVQQTANSIKQTVSQTYATKAALEGMKIGTRNLLLGTSSPQPYKKSSNQADYPSSENPGAWGWYANRTASVERTDFGIKMVQGSSSGTSGLVIPLSHDGSIMPNTEYTLAFRYRTNMPNLGNCYVLKRTLPNYVFLATEDSVVNGDGEWHDFEVTFTPVWTDERVPYAILIGYRNTADEWLEIADASMCLVEGNQLPSWGPAPEDLLTNDAASTLYTSKTEFEQTANGIRSTAQSALTTAQNIRVGGRNLLRNSAFDTTGSWVYDGIGGAIENGTLVIDGSTTSNNNRRVYHDVALFTHVIGEVYSISFEAYSDVACTIGCGRTYAAISAANRFGCEFEITTTKKRYSGTYTAKTTGAFCFAQPSNNATVTIDNVKLERGNSPTDWTPAPEDLETVNHANEVYTSKTEFEQTTDQITLTAEAALRKAGDAGNMLLDWNAVKADGTLTLSKIDGPAKRYISDGSSARAALFTIVDPPEPGIVVGTRFTFDGSQTTNSVKGAHCFYGDNAYVAMTEGQEYTFSFWARRVSGTCAYYCQAGSSPYQRKNGSHEFKEENALGDGWQQIVWTFTYTAAKMGGDGKGCRLYPGIVAKANTAGVGEVCGYRLVPGKSADSVDDKLSNYTQRSEFTVAPDKIASTVADSLTSAKGYADERASEIEQTAKSLALSVESRTTNFPNVTEWFERTVSDKYHATNNPDGYWAYLHAYNSSMSNTEGRHAIYTIDGNDPVSWPELEGNGWAHITLDSRSSAGNVDNKNCYMNMNVEYDHLPVTEGVDYTWLAEVRNLTWEGPAGKYLTVTPSVGNATLDKLSSANVASMRFVEDGDGRCKVTAKSDFSVLTGPGSYGTRGYCYIPTGCYADFWLRVSLYKCPVIDGESVVYAGPYKPYVPSSAEVYEARAAITINQTNIQSEVEARKQAIDELQSGGGNILRNINLVFPDGTSAYGGSNTWDAGRWAIGSGGNGTGTVIAISDPPDGLITHGLRITGNTSGNRDIQQNYIPVAEGATYTQGVWARLAEGVSSGKLLMRGWATAGNKGQTATGAQWSSTKNLTSEWTWYSVTKTAPSGLRSINCLFGTTGSSSGIELCGFSLVRETTGTADISSRVLQTESDITRLFLYSSAGLDIRYYSHTSPTTPPGDTVAWSELMPARDDDRYIWMWVRKYEYDSNNQKSLSSSTKTCISGSNGTPGINGLNSTSVMLYQRASSSPAKPSSALTYTFSTGKLSGTLGNWTQTIPDGTNPLWVIMATAMASADATMDSIPTSEWSAPVKMAENGGTGASAYSYNLLCSPSAITKSNDGTLSPTSVSFSATRSQGTGSPSSYSGRFKIEEYNGSTWSTNYTSSGNEASKSYTPSATAKLIRCTLYLAGGTTTVLDNQTVPVVSDGNNGSSVTVTTIQYSSSTSGTSAPTSNWSTSVPSVAAGSYLWTRVNFSDGTHADTVARQGSNGNPGINGTSYYTHIRYSTNSNGSSFTTSPTSTTAYIGIYTGTSSTAPTTASSYTWSNFKGAKGDNGDDAYTVVLTNESHTFQAGTSAAVSGSAVCNVIAYKGATQVPAKIGSISAPPSGMLVSIDSTKNNTIEAEFTVSVTSTLTTKSGVLTVPITVDGKTFTKKFTWSLSLTGQTGTAGTNSATVYLYKRSATTPSKPGSSTTYKFSDGTLSSVPSGWSRLMPTANGDPCWVTTAAAISNNATVQIGTSAWSDPVKMSDDILNITGTCTTAAGTAKKVCSDANATPYLNIGSSAAIKFTNDNTANSVTLNINGTGDLPLVAFNQQVSSESLYKLKAGYYITVVYATGVSYTDYNGTTQPNRSCWVIADAAALVPYVREDTDGLFVGTNYNSGYSYVANDGGFYVKKKKTNSTDKENLSTDISLAEFTASKAQIGVTTARHAILDSSGVTLKDGTTTLANFTSTSARIGKVAAGSKNLLTNANGVYLYDNTTLLASFTPSGVTLNDENNDGTSRAIASFSANSIQLGPTYQKDKSSSSRNILMGTTSTGGTKVAIRDGATEIASFSDSAVVLGRTSERYNALMASDQIALRYGGTVVAGFTANKIELGKNSSTSTISLCNGAGILGIRTLNNSQRFALSSDNGIGLVATNSNGNPLLLVSSSGISLYYNWTVTGKTPTSITMDDDGVNIYGLNSNNHSIMKDNIGWRTQHGGTYTCNAYNTADVRMKTTNSKISLSSLARGYGDTNGTYFGALSSNGIKCLQAGKVVVSASVRANELTSGGLAIQIYKNSSAVGMEAITNAGGIAQETVNITPMIINVVANDVIYLYGRSTAAGLIPMYGAQLTVQYTG